MKEKIYLVRCVTDNLMEYEDSRIDTEILKAFYSKVSAERYIKNWKPNAKYTDDESEIRTLAKEIGVYNFHINGIFSDYNKDAVRYVFAYEHQYWPEMHMFYIDEMEVE